MGILDESAERLASPGPSPLNIDCGQGLFYEGDGLLEEAFVHEAADGDSRSRV